MDLATPWIIINYEGQTTLTQTFSQVERCDRAFFQHDASYMVSWMTNASMSKKATTATSSLAEIQREKTLHSWRCQEFGHTKNDLNFLKNLKKKGQSTKKPKQKIETVRVGEKSKKKELKCTHCGRLNHDLDHCFVLHCEKCPMSEKEKAMEAKIAELEKRFNIVALLGQVTNAEWTSQVGVSESTTNPYTFGASGKMVVAAATRAQ